MITGMALRAGTPDAAVRRVSWLANPHDFAFAGGCLACRHRGVQGNSRQVDPQADPRENHRRIR